MKNFLPLVMLSVALVAAPAFADSSFDTAARVLDQAHSELIVSHHLEASVDPDSATHEIIKAPNGAPLSIIFEKGGISTYFVSKDGTQIHTFIKAHEARFGIPEGLEIAFDVSVSNSPVIDFHRIYGVLEYGTIISDIKSVIADVQSPEWRETTVTLSKMVLCAQMTKLLGMHGIPVAAQKWLLSAMKPVCGA